MFSILLKIFLSQNPSDIAEATAWSSQHIRLWQSELLSRTRGERQEERSQQTEEQQGRHAWQRGGGGLQAGSFRRALFSQAKPVKKAARKVPTAENMGNRAPEKSQYLCWISHVLRTVLNGGGGGFCVSLCMECIQQVVFKLG